MARYIDADRLKRTFASGIRVYDGMCKIDDVMHNIENEPTADVVEVKHGEWIKCQKLYGIGHEYVCSACEKGIRQYEGQPFCSECGAKMDGGKTE